MKAAIFALLLAPAFAQAQTTLATLHAVIGGCSLTKQDGATIHATWGCQTSDKSIQQSGSLKPAVSGSVQIAVLMFGQQQISISCLFIINPTLTPIPGGSLPDAPPNGISWSCTADGGAPQNGTAMWP